MPDPTSAPGPQPPSPDLGTPPPIQNATPTAEAPVDTSSGVEYSAFTEFSNTRAPVQDTPPAEEAPTDDAGPVMYSGDMSMEEGSSDFTPSEGSD
jgi:hypothetical protein